MSRRRLFRLFGRRARERELDDEIEAHLAFRAEELERQGWSPEAARLEARRRFGDLEPARRAMRRGALRRDLRVATAAWFDTLAADLALGLRRARRSPGFTLLSVVALALSVGLTTAVFTVVDRTLLRPLPFPEPDRLVALYSVGEGEAFPWVSSENWLDWEAGNRSLDGSALYDPVRPAVVLESGPVRVQGLRVSEGFFDVLRPPLVRGRYPAPDEVRGGARLAVTSERFWRRAMGENATLPLSLDVAGEVVDIVGVTAGGHEFPAGTELWLPRSYRPRGVGMARNSINYHAVGRLHAGWDLDRARADLDAVARGIREQAPEALYSEGVGVIPLRDHVTGSVERELLLVLGAVAGVLLLACVNLAGLGLARTLERTGELGVRVALGAPRRRVVRQLLTEHALLALAGGVMGVAAAAGLVALAGRNLAGVVPGSETLAVDGRVLLFALALTGLTAMLSGGLPALRGRSLARSAAGAGRAAVGGGGAVGRRLGGPSLGGTLVVAQVSLAMVLLVGAGLLLRSFQRLVSRDLGFEPPGVYVGDIALEGSRYRMAPGYAGSRALDDPGAAARRAFFDEVVTRLGRHPAVSGATVANRMPAGRSGNGFIEVEGWVGEEVQGAGYSAVGHDYFQILGTPRIAGRTFSRLDDAGSDRVVVVNRAMARAYWPGEDPLGRRVRALSMEGDGSSAPWLTVIGVVDDVLEGGFDDEPSPHMYVLAEQVPYWMGTMYVVFRTDAGAEAIRELRDAVASLDRSVPVEVSQLEDRLGSLIRERRAVTGLLSVFAGLALLLAAVGLYALLAFQVARRTREMGVRAALGADRARLTRMILGHGLRLSGWGVGLGLAAAWVCVRVLTSFLVDVAPVDPATWAGAAGLLLAIGLLSAGGPAWRAARADPLTALRSD